MTLRPKTPPRSKRRLQLLRRDRFVRPIHLLSDNRALLVLLHPPSFHQLHRPVCVRICTARSSSSYAISAPSQIQASVFEMFWERITTKTIAFLVQDVGAQVCCAGDADDGGEVVAVGGTVQEKDDDACDGGESGEENREPVCDPEGFSIVSVDVVVSGEGDVG